MKISNPVKIYSDAQQNYSPSLRSGGNNNALAKTNNSGAELKVSSSSSQLQDPNKLITSKERNFFVKMFPENSDQLQKHVLFNRNGKLQTPNISKGSVFDGKA